MKKKRKITVKAETKKFVNAIQKTTAAFERFSMVMALCEMEAACEREFSNRVADWLRQ